MKSLLWLVLAGLLAASPLAACPSCKNATPVKRAGGSEPLPDPKSLSKGFNYSIYFMLSMVYGVPTVMGLVLWRTISAHQARRRRISNPMEMNAIPRVEEAGS